MYCLLSSQVFSGEGRSGATVVLSIVQMSSMTPIPKRGRTIVAKSIRLVILNLYAMLWTGNFLAYSSGLLGSNSTSSNNVSFCMSSFGTAMPISFATSRKMSGR